MLKASVLAHLRYDGDPGAEVVETEGSDVDVVDEDGPAGCLDDAEESHR